MVWTSIRYQKFQDPCARLQELYLYCICNAVLKFNMLSLMLFHYPLLGSPGSPHTTRWLNLARNITGTGSSQEGHSLIKKSAILDRIW